MADREFRRFLAAHSISFAGTTVSYVVIPLLVFGLSGSAALTSLTVGLQIVPYLVFGLAAGSVADRADRQRLMVRCELLAAALFATVPVASVLDRLTVAHLLVVAAGGGVAFVWFDAANFGALPALVGRERVVGAMSAMWSIDGVIQVGGPALAGLLVAVVDPALVLGLDAISYVVSAGLLATIRRPFRVAGQKRATGVRGRAAVYEGARFVWSHPVMRPLTLLGVTVSFAMGTMFGLVVPFAVESLGLSEQGRGIGVLYSAGALGGVLGARALPRLRRRARVPSITSAGQATAAVSLLGLAFQTRLPLALGLFLVLQCAQYLVIMNGIAYRQEVTPDHLQGRVNVLARMIAVSGQPLGALAGGVLATIVGIRWALLTAAVVLGAGFVAGRVGPLRLEGGTSSGAMPKAC